MKPKSRTEKPEKGKSGNRATLGFETKLWQGAKFEKAIRENLKGLGFGL